MENFLGEDKLLKKKKAWIEEGLGSYDPQGINLLIY